METNPDTALRLARYFGTRPEWWLDLQTHHDLEVARDQLEVRIVRTVQPRVALQAAFWPSKIRVGR